MFGLVSVLVLGCSWAVIGLPFGVPGMLAGLAVGLGPSVAFGRVVARNRVYQGFRLFAVDHSWSLLNTMAGSVYLLLHLWLGHQVRRAETLHSGQIQVDGRLARGYAMTIGNLVAGATAGQRRHEALHVFQARLLGPLYFPAVGLNYLVFSLVPVWLLYHDHARWPVRGPVSYFTCGVYPHVWHEAWAYRRDLSER